MPANFWRNATGEVLVRVSRLYCSAKLAATITIRRYTDFSVSRASRLRLLLQLTLNRPSQRMRDFTISIYLSRVSLRIRTTILHLLLKELSHW